MNCSDGRMILPLLNQGNMKKEKTKWQDDSTGWQINGYETTGETVGAVVSVNKHRPYTRRYRNILHPKPYTQHVHTYVCLTLWLHVWSIGRMHPRKMDGRFYRHAEYLELQWSCCVQFQRLSYFPPGVERSTLRCFDTRASRMPSRMVPTTHSPVLPVHEASILPRRCTRPYYLTFPIFPILSW